MMIFFPNNVQSTVLKEDILFFMNLDGDLVL